MEKRTMKKLGGATVILLTILMLATPAVATQYKIKSITVPAIGNTPKRLVDTPNTWANTVLFQPYISHASALMWIGDSGVKATHGIKLIHGSSLNMDAPNISIGDDMFDLYNFWAVCDSVLGADFSSIGKDCSVTITYPVQE